MTIRTEGTQQFLTYLDHWMDSLTSIQYHKDILSPQKTAVISVDMIKGFCNTGPLASPRVTAIIHPVVSLLNLAWQAGTRNILLLQDTHDPKAVEFGSWPAHCVRGTEEAETVKEITDLPFFSEILVIEKNSISSGFNTGLADWMKSHLEINTYIVVGDCTDLCTYQLAMHLRLDANARQIERRVIVPASAVETYDRPLEAAQVQGGFPHPGDLLHATFLYHMALNGIEVVKEVLP